MTTISFDNYQEVAKEKTKGLGLTPSARELFSSVLYWAISKNSLTDTVAVTHRTRNLVTKLASVGLVKENRTGYREQYTGAELLGDYIIDNPEGKKEKELAALRPKEVLELFNISYEGEHEITTNNPEAWIKDHNSKREARAQEALSEFEIVKVEGRIY